MKIPGRDYNHEKPSPPKGQGYSRLTTEGEPNGSVGELLLEKASLRVGEREDTAVGSLDFNVGRTSRFLKEQAGEALGGAIAQAILLGVGNNKVNFAGNVIVEIHSM